MLLLAILLFLVPTGRAQEVSAEYRTKAVFLINFVKFVEWPETSSSSPVTICLAGRNPFGSLLDDGIKGEHSGERLLTTRIILEPEPGCDVVFIPRGSATTAYLRAARGTSTLTVGEIDNFIQLGGIIGFYPDGSDVKFAINPDAAERAKLRVSSRLLQLARIVNDRGETR